MKSSKPAPPKTRHISVDAPQGSLGNAIRAHRKLKDMTLVVLAKRAGFSISYLSQIERSLLTPSIETLRRIAEILAIPAGQLMLKDARQPNSPVAVVRRSERKRLAFPGSSIRYELLTPDMRRRASLLWVEAPPAPRAARCFPMRRRRSCRAEGQD